MGTVIDRENLPPHYSHILVLWEAGVSGGEIAREMKRTRSSVMSIVRKLRLKGLVTRIRENDNSKKVMRDAVTGEITIRSRAFKRVNRNGNGVSAITNLFRRVDRGFRKAPKDIKNSKVRGDEIYIEELNIFTCRYINGEIDGVDTLYCGHKVERGVYCAQHAKLCYVPRDRP